MKLLAIDPGTEQSAYVVYDTDTGNILHHEKAENGPILRCLSTFPAHACAIEMIASYGMPVGAEVFETCVWIGRFIQQWKNGHPKHAKRVTRLQAKSHLCHSGRATDSNVRQALIDRYGPGKEKAIGRKASPGPLYGISGDCWAALAVAVTAAEEVAGEYQPLRRFRLDDSAVAGLPRNPAARYVGRQP